MITLIFSRFYFSCLDCFDSLILVLICLIVLIFPLFSCFSCSAETPLTIASARDTTISSEDLRTWLREQARGDTFLATLDHTFDATPQSRDVLNAVCTHYQGVMASVATSSSAWIEFEPLVAPVKGTFIVSEVRFWRNSSSCYLTMCCKLRVFSFEAIY